MNQTRTSFHGIVYVVCVVWGGGKGGVVCMVCVVCVVCVVWGGGKGGAVCVVRVVWGGGRGGVVCVVRAVCMGVGGGRHNNTVMCLVSNSTMSCYPTVRVTRDPCWSWSGAKTEMSTYLARETLYRAGLSNKQQRMTPVSRN